MKKKVRIGAITMLMTLTTSLTGCGTNLAKIPLQSQLTQREITDYYTEAMKYKAEVEHAVVFNHKEYEMNDVDDITKKDLIAALDKVESNLGADVWNEDMFVKKDQHQAFKALIDDKVLNRSGDDIEVKESQGHYFVTVKYNVSAQAVGRCTENMKYVGLHGAYTSDAYGVVMLDPIYPKAVEEALNIWDTGKQPNSSELKYLTMQQAIDIVKEREKTVERNVSGNSSTSSELVDINPDLRVASYDVKLINKMFGASTKQTALLPALTTVYQPASHSGALSGYGIYPQGGFTLRNFGYNRDAMNGTLTLRYVFKKGLVDTSIIEFKNVYITDMELDTSSIAQDTSVVPEFVATDIKTAINRADRCVCNNDLTGLMNSEVFADIGPAILTGFTHQFSYLQQNESTVTKVVGRESNVSNNYLAQVTTLKKVGAKGGEDYANYKLSGYVVLTQIGSNFVITDYLYDKCELVREPQINVDDTILKRLASLVNSTVISPEDKEGLQEMINNLYAGCTERKSKAILNSFNDDVNLLASTRKTYLVQQLMDLIVAYDSKDKPINTTFTGFVAEWIGGTDDQAEFITQEIMEYPGLDTGIYFKTYYLASRYGDGWVIDERKHVESKEVHGQELADIKANIEKQQVFNVSGAEISDEVQQAAEDIAAEADEDGAVIKEEKAGASEENSAENAETAETDDTESAE